MNLYITDGHCHEANMGCCISYGQFVNKNCCGWLFNLATGLSLFIPFDDIALFTTYGDLKILNMREYAEMNLDKISNQTLLDEVCRLSVAITKTVNEMNRQSENNLAQQLDAVIAEAIRRMTMPKP